MRRRLAIALLATLTACSEVPDGVTPTPRASADVTAERLAGTWVFGESAEPAAGPVVACSARQMLTLEQTGQTLSAGVSTCAGPCAVLERLEGSNQNGKVSLKGEYKGNFSSATELTTYELTYNAQTQHLVGTRNGRPFWAAPLVKPTGTECEGRIE